MSASIELRGLADLEEKLLLIGQVGGQRAIRQALFHATKPILDQAKANVQAWPRGSGSLHQALGRRFQATNQQEGARFVMQIGPRPAVRLAVALHNLAYQRKRNAIFHGHFLEFGHELVRRSATDRVDRRGRAKYVRQGLGKVPPQRFLGPALDSRSLAATFIFQNQLRRRIERALKKLSPETDNA